MKKILIVVLTLALILSVAACQQQVQETTETTKPAEPAVQAAEDSKPEEPKEKFTVGIAQCDFSDKWQSYLTDALIENCEKNGLDYILTDGKLDPGIQLANVENMIQQGADAIILVIIDATTAPSFVQICKEAQVPLVAVNRLMEGADCFVGSDGVYCGQIIAEEIARQLEYKGKILSLRGVIGMAVETERSEGVESVIDKYPDLEIVSIQSAEWVREKALTITENWIQSGIEFDAIICSNDEMAIGAIRALEGSGITDKLVAGVDATPDALAYFETGQLACTALLNAKGEAAGAVQAVVDLLNGKKVDAVITIPYELVTIENYKDYL